MLVLVPVSPCLGYFVHVYPDTATCLTALHTLVFESETTSRTVELRTFVLGRIVGVWGREGRDFEGSHEVSRKRGGMC